MSIAGVNLRVNHYLLSGERVVVSIAGVNLRDGPLFVGWGGYEHSKCK